MNNLQRLIERLCPNGVLFKCLGEFCSIQTGRGITNKDTSDNGLYPVISGGVEPMGFYREYNRNENTVTIARAGGAGYVNFITTKFYLNDKCFSVIPNNGMNTRYLYHALKNIEPDIVSMKSTGSVPTVNTAKVSSIRIPVPPMEVQDEIVRILDNFTKLTAELTAKLTAELTARKKQYDYYLQHLMVKDCSSAVELREIVLKVHNIKWENSSKETFRYIDLSSVSRENGSIGETSIIDANNHPSRAQQIVRKHDILFGTTRPLLKRQTIIDDEYDGDICSTGFCVLRPNVNMVLPEWIYYNIQTQSFYLHAQINLIPGNYPSISDSSVKSFRIPLPPIEEQKIIIGLLKKYNDYCNNISQGLPAEIEALQKQYEYYRNKLLSFKELKS